MAKGRTGGGNPEGITVGRISIKVSPDTRKFRTELKQELEEIEKSLKGDIEINGNFDAAQAKADFKRFMEQLKAEGARGVKIKANVDYNKGRVPSPGGGGGRGRRGKDGEDTSIWDVAAGGRKGINNLWPNFGSGINPAGYIAILAGAALVAAPLVGIISTAVLAIPGMISAIATPFMAITLGLDGIKKAAAGSGLFSLDKKGEIDGLGAVFDNVKAEVSKAFEGGLDQPLKDIAAAIDPLLQSLPQVATGLTDMFKGFTDSLTSSEGMALFDDTIKNIGAAMSQAAPGVKSFTDGMLMLANSFTQNLPGLSNWFNKTGDSFSKWMEEMSKPIEGPGIDGKSKLDMAFEGLGGTLKTIGDWAVDMGEAGLKFATDPQKMKDFIATLDNIGAIITKLTDMGNQMAGVWREMGLLPRLDPATAKAEADKIINPPKAPDGADAKPPEKNLFGKIGDWLTSDGPGTKFFKDLFPKPPEEIKADIKSVNDDITALQTAIQDRLKSSPYKPEDDYTLSNYKQRLADARAQLEQLKAEAGAAGAQVGLASSETPLSGSGSDYFTGKLVNDLTKIPAAAQTAQTALQGVKSSGELFGGAGAQPQQQAPVEPPKVEAPDLSGFKAGLDGMGEVAAQAMATVTTSIQAGGATAAGAAQIAGVQIKDAIAGTAVLFQTVGLAMMQGLATGIQAGQSMAISAAVQAATAAYEAAKGALDINSPSKKFIELGKSTGEGMAIGMDKGFEPVLAQAKDLSEKITAAFDSGGDPTSLLDGFSKKESSAMEKVLSFQSHRLQRQAKGLDRQFKATGDQRFKDQADGIRTQIDALADQKDALDLAAEYADLKGGGQSDWKGPIAKMMESASRMPMDFMKATSQQAMQDLGISGGGLMGALMDYGTELGNSFVFNVGNMDDALTAHQNLVNRQNLGVTGR